jgi:hypothetical protein
VKGRGAEDSWGLGGEGSNRDEFRGGQLSGLTT